MYLPAPTPSLVSSVCWVRASVTFSPASSKKPRWYAAYSGAAQMSPPITRGSASWAPMTPWLVRRIVRYAPVPTAAVAASPPIVSSVRRDGLPRCD